MSYFKIGDNDYSMYVNELTIGTNVAYNSQTNAAGNTVVDYINEKRVITVGIIPLNDTVMKDLKADIKAFNVNISFRNPDTNELAEDVNVIIPANEVSYYTIQVNNVMYNAISLQFTEL